MEELTSADIAGPSNIQTTVIDREEGTSKGPNKVPKTQICSKKAKALKKKAEEFAKEFGSCNICLMIGSSVKRKKWHVSQLRNVSNDAQWENAMQTFIETRFAEKEEDKTSIFVNPDSNVSASHHDMALNLAVQRGIFSRYQYEGYLQILEEVKKGKGMLLIFPPPRS